MSERLDLKWERHDGGGVLPLEFQLILEKSKLTKDFQLKISRKAVATVRGFRHPDDPRNKWRAIWRFSEKKHAANFPRSVAARNWIQKDLAQNFPGWFRFTQIGSGNPIDFNLPTFGGDDDLISPTGYGG